MFESQLMQMPGPRDIVIYWPGTRAFSVVQKPRGWEHISVQKPRGARGMLTGQIDTCISTCIQFLFIRHPSRKSKILDIYLVVTL